jgi:hypothetical protein
LGWHQVAVVQYTFTYKQYIEHNRHKTIHRTQLTRKTQSVNKKCSAISIIMTILLATLLISHTRTCESKFPDEGPAGQKHITTQYRVSFTPTCVYCVHTYFNFTINCVCLKEHPSTIQVYWVVTLCNQTFLVYLFIRFTCIIYR